jgi:hypothetical protein
MCVCSLNIIVDTDGFRRFAEGIPNFLAPSNRKAMREIAVERQGEQMEFIKLALFRINRRPGCMMDLWKDRVGNHFIGIAISFIVDDWTIHVVNLAILSFSGSHTAENIKVRNDIISLIHILVTQIRSLYF